MARRINEEQFTARRKDILNAALELIALKGYQQMTIQDILDQLGISKGAFYHYFDSKSAVLEAVIDQMVDELFPHLEAIVNDPHSTALDKLNRYFVTANRWKIGQKDVMSALARLWYPEGNSIVRFRITNRLVERITPLLAQILRQGVSEGNITTPYVETTCQVMIYMVSGLQETFVKLIQKDQLQKTDLDHLQYTVDAYTDASERILGSPEGSLTLIDDTIVRQWFDYFASLSQIDLQEE